MVHVYFGGRYAKDERKKMWNEMKPSYNKIKHDVRERHRSFPAADPAFPRGGANLKGG